MLEKLYPVIDETLYKNLNIKIDKTFYYLKDGNKIQLNEEYFDDINDTIFSLEDENYEWDIKLNGLLLDISINIENVKSLFKIDGVAYQDSILGVGIEWKSEKSRIKYCKKIGVLDFSSDSFNLVKENIEILELSGNTHFSIIFYVVEPGTINDNSFFGNEKGLILYNDRFMSIIVDGQTSISPIYEEENPDSSLWRFKCNVEDIFEDEFSTENLAIIINRLHPSYPLLNPKEKSYMKSFFVEVVSSALSMLIIEIKKGSTIDLNNNGAQGSVLVALRYFNSLGIKINGTNEELITSVKQFFDKRY